jgi:predicted small lipoprotein YifL
MRLFPASLLLLPLVALTACEPLGIPDPAKEAAAKEAEGKAIGSACRHAVRAIEDCYTLNPKAQKAAVYQGWREMDEYMRENKLEGVAPVVPRTDAKKPRRDEEEEAAPPPKKSSA